MRWRTGRRSSNVEDRRGKGMKRGLVGGGIGTILIALVAMYFGVDPSVVMQQGASSGGASRGGDGAYQPSAHEQELAAFASTVLADTEDTWTKLFQQAGKRYQKPKLVLYSGITQSACGTGQAAMGPFYCPGDYKVYLDLSFFDELQRRHDAPGDFAQAYVLAHEVGHHVQNLLGISDKVNKLRRKLSKEEFNRVSVRMELQADCLAGVWANHADRDRQILERGDIEEALNAATQIGDDRLQKQAQGYVVPESFTHGTSEQRMRWFARGMKGGEIASCNTFKANRL